MFDKKILINISSLFSIQVATYIIPIITLPYLVRVLGIEGYGYLGFSLAIIQYAILIINYGFDLSATSSIAKVKHDKRKVSIIFWSIFCIRLTAWLISLVIILSLSIVSDTLSSSLQILVAHMTLAIGAALFPQWLFQGKEQLGIISFVRVFAQFLSVPLLLLFVKNEDDVWIAAFISGLPSLIVAIYSLFLIKKRRWIIFLRPSLREIKFQLYDGWHIFISTAAVSLYTSGVTVVLGFFSGPISVGYFVAAERIIKAVLGLYSTVSRAFYPRINSIIEESRKDAEILVIKLGKLLLAFSLLCSVFLFVFSDFGVRILFGSGHDVTAEILKIFSILPIVISISNIFGVQVLIPFGYKKEFSKVLIISGFTSLLILLPLVGLYNEFGAAISVVITELLVTSLMVYKVVKLKIISIYP
ncbi:flippase [Vibrio vulnificus]|uniref:flippase n=1 Tax=Vibrio vulnificus TaxID=672 RepID=UPI00163CE892|nr:flippase [Vibrio vulnificus]QND99888.1 flippase [Vibrio vulnificus]